MSIDNKYGVPIRDDKDERGALVQPKFTNRFRVLFQDLGHAGDLSVDMNSRQYLTAQVESFTRPTIDFGNKPVTSFIGKGHVSGRPNYGEIKFVIRDDITNAAISYLYQQLQKHIDRMYPQQRNNSGNIIANKQLGQDTKFNVIMEVMDGRTNHTPIEIWEFYGCLYNNITFSDNSYENDSDIATVSVSCTFDNMRVHRPEKQLFAGRDYDEQSSVAADRRSADILNRQKAEELITKIENSASNAVMKTVNKVKQKFLGF